MSSFLSYAGKSKQAENLANSLCNRVNFEETNISEINNIPNNTLYNLLLCASIRGDAIFFAGIMDELYFNRGLIFRVQNELTYWGHDEIRKTEEVIKFEEKMTAHIAPMRTNVINYLKEKDAWLEYINE